MSDAKILKDDLRIKDWRWRLNNLYKIVDKDGKMRTFKENGIQRQINNSKKRRKMILKYRQGGVTTNESLKMLDFVAHKLNKNACLMADDQGNMEKIFSKVRYAHSKMPLAFRPKIDRGGGSKYELRFPDINGRMYCSLEGRGDTIHWLHISEAAFAKPERIKATLEAVPLNGVVTFESTPNGMGNHFYRRWITKSDRLAKLFFPWFFHEEYRLDGSHVVLTKEEGEFCKKVKRMFDLEITKDQIAFRRAKQEDQTELFIQEYPEDDVTCFLASGGSAMDLEIIRNFLLSAPDPIEDTGTMKIFKKFDSTRLYAIGADTAEGRGGDNSVAVVMDVATREEVAQICSNRWKPMKFAQEIFKLAEMYHKPGREWPLVGVERNNHGHAVLLQLQEHLSYPNLYYYKDDDEDAAGWHTNSVTRPVMIDTFIEGTEDGTIVLNSRDTLGECLTLIDNNGKIEAEEGENDDRIIANAIAVQMCIKQSPLLGLYSNLSESILL